MKITFEFNEKTIEEKEIAKRKWFTRGMALLAIERKEEYRDLTEEEVLGVEEIGSLYESPSTIGLLVRVIFLCFIVGILGILAVELLKEIQIFFICKSEGITRNQYNIREAIKIFENAR